MNSPLNPSTNSYLNLTPIPSPQSTVILPIIGYDLPLQNHDPLYSQIMKKKYPIEQLTKDIPGNASSLNIISNLVTPMIFTVNFALLLLMILTIYSITALAQHLISALEPLLTTALKQPTTLTQDTLLYNYTNTTGTTHVIISKLASLIRLSLFNVKNYSSLYHKPIPSSFLNDEKFKIKTKFKTFIQQYFPDNVRKT